MSDLKPCPFCGGVPLRDSHGAFGLCIRCSACGAMLSSKATPGRLDVAWNRRAERTCRNLSSIGWKFTCSECHSSIRPGESNMPSYCPDCVARVVSG